MTRIKEKAVEMIQRMPDDDMFYVINILQNLEEMTARKDTDKERAMAAYQDILRYRGRLPEDFDADKELAEAREEKYGNLG
ncbi:MAG: dihydrodipicolinate reductase [Lachnospiraceae bacterium]|nr:dihydrodipicolinate reductase [Lachnospiraceae bacterium]